MSNVLEVSGLRKSYGKYEAVKGDRILTMKLDLGKKRRSAVSHG